MSGKATLTPGFFTPGDLVRHPERPDWGLGQVQSCVGDKVSVNFENAGKCVINTALIKLTLEHGP